MGPERVKYPFGKVAVYWCTVISVLSVATSLLILYVYTTTLISYFITAAILTFVMFKLKLRYLLKRQSESLENRDKKNMKLVQNAGRKWRTILLVVGFTLAAILSIVSVGFLDPATWFMYLNSFVTSVSLSEVFLYISLSRMPASVALARA